MANRFWVGGGSSTNWNATANTNWSATNGGPNNATVPTSVDDVFFTSLSGAGAKVISANISIQSLDCTGHTGTITHNAAVTLTLAGNGGVFKLVAGMTYTLGNATTSALAFTGTSGNMLITTGTKVLGNVDFNGLGGTRTLQDAFNTGVLATITLTAGTLDANGQNLSIGAFTAAIGTAVRTLTMGSGNWTVNTNAGTQWNTSVATNFTLNAGTSTIISAGGVSKTLSMTASRRVNNVTIQGAFAGVTLTFTNVTCNNLTFSHTIIVAFTFTMSTTLDIAGSLVMSSAGMGTLSGNGTMNFSSTAGTKTITANGSSWPTNVTFNGVGGTWQLADNFTVASGKLVTLTNGVFDANGKNVTIGGFSSSNANIRTIAMGAGTWTMTSTFAGGWVTNNETNLTLTGTTVVNFTGDLMTFNGGATKRVSLVVAGSLTGSVALSGSCDDLTFTHTGAGKTTSGSITTFGNVNLGSGVLTSTSLNLTFGNTSGTKTLTTQAHSIGGLTMNGVGGTVQLSDAVTMVNNIGLTNGTLDLNGKAVSCSQISGSNSNIRAILFGSSVVTITGTNPISIATQTNLTWTPGTSALLMTGAVSTFTSGTLSFYDLSFTNVPTTAGSTQGLLIANSFSCHNVSFVRSTSNPSLVSMVNLAGPTFTGATPVTITASGLFTASGLDAINRLYISYHGLHPINGHIEGNAGTISAASASLSYVDFSDIVATGAAIWSGTSVGNCLGNTGITFTATVTRYWVSNSGNWTDTAKWSATSGGSTGASVPLAQDIVRFDVNSFSISGQTVTLNASILGADIDFTGVTNNPTITIAEAYTTYKMIYGSLTLASGVVATDTTGNSNLPSLEFSARTAKTISGFGVELPFTCYFRSHGGSYTLQNAFSIKTGGTNEYYLELKSGTLDTNSQAVQCASVELSQDIINVRTLTLGSTIWTMNGTFFNQWVSGTPSTNLILNAGTSTIRLIGNSASGSSVISDQNLYDIVFALGASANGGGTDVSVCHNITVNNVGTGQQFSIVGNSPNTVNRLDFNMPNGGLATGGFALIANTFAVNAAGVNVYFSDGITNVLTSMFLAGRPGSPIVMQSQNPGFQYILSVSNGIAEFVNVTDSHVVTAQPIVDFGGVNGGNNTAGGWAFASAVQNPTYAGND